MQSAEPSHNGNIAPSPILARNVAAVAQLEAADRARQSSAEHFSDSIARVAGTPWFAWLHVAWFAAWVAWNAGFVPGWHPIDPFPFSFLTLVVSLEAIFLSIFVLISQNNLTRLSERRAHLDLQINLLAEQESTKTVALLERIAQRLNVSVPDEPSESELATPTDIRDVVSTLDSVLTVDSRPSVPRTRKGGSDDGPEQDPEWTSNVPDRRHWTIPSAAPERRLDQIAGPDPTVVHREPPATALAGARGLPDVERQDRRLHEDRPHS